MALVLTHPTDLATLITCDQVTKAAIWDATNTETGELGPHYLVHYKGWKQTLVPFLPLLLLARCNRSRYSRSRPFSQQNSWDEWVSEDRLKKHNEENLKKQKALIEAQRARDQAERIALAKANEAELSRKTGAPSGMGGLGGGGGMGNGNGISGSGLMPSGAGRRDEKRGAKRPQGDGVSLFSSSSVLSSFRLSSTPVWHGLMLIGLYHC